MQVTQPGGQLCKKCKCMQVAPPDDQILNQSKLCHLVAKFTTNASGAIWWPNLQLMQVAPSGGRGSSYLSTRPTIVLSPVFTPKYINLLVKFATNAGGAMLLPNLVQVTESISRSVVPLAMFVGMPSLWLKSFY